MRHLLVLTPVLDAADPVQGFALGWLNALAARLEQVTAVALRQGDTAPLSANVLACGLGRPAASRAQVALRLHRSVLETRADACLVHMNWPMLLAAGPVLRARGIPTALWWAHGAAPLGLRAAAKFADLLLTSTAGACRIAPAKRRVLGQGIDTEHFRPAAAEPAAPVSVLCAGRIAPVKRLRLVVEACARAGLPLRLVGAGRIDGLVSEPPRAHAAMPALLRSAHIFATASATGSPDKAALEAMACGLPVVALGEGLQGALPPALAAQVIVDDVGAMAARLAELAAAGAARRRDLGLALREAVIARHALDRLAGRIVAVFGEC